MKGSYQTFEDTFQILLEKAKKGAVSVETVMTILSGRGKILLLIFLSLVFGQIPGVSIVLGLFIAYLGVTITTGHGFIWMPKTLLHKKIPSYFLIRVIKQILRFLKFMKRWSHPRYTWATQQTATHVLNGIMIVLVGLALAVSPPVPLSGLLSFLAIFFIGIGLLNDDGIYIIIGYICTLCYVVTILFLLEAFEVLKCWLGI